MKSSVSTVLQTKAAVYLPKLQAWFKSQAGEGLERLETRFYLIVGSIGIAYLLSNIVGGIVGNMMVNSIILTRAKISIHGDDNQSKFERPLMANSRDLLKIVKDRNIFNSEGKVPEEKFGSENRGSSAKFDIDGPCASTALPIELLGTIFLGDRFKSLATVKDKNYSEADIYRVGDVIYGNEQATVAAVERQKIIINNDGVKECIDLDKSANNVANDGFPGGGSGDFGGMPNNGAGGGSEITLEASYVEGELGPGFGKIVDAARLVPNTVDGGINGFKIFSIKGGSLFARIGLQNGDVISQVNETSMKDPAQGFALYQSLQDEKEVRLQLLRGGLTPTNITIRIK